MLDSLKKSGADNASAAVVDQDFGPSEFFYKVCNFTFGIFAEEHLCGCKILEIKHFMYSFCISLN